MTGSSAACGHLSQAAGCPAAAVLHHRCQALLTGVSQAAGPLLQARAAAASAQKQPHTAQHLTLVPLLLLRVCLLPRPPLWQLLLLVPPLFPCRLLLLPVWRLPPQLLHPPELAPPPRWGCRPREGLKKCCRWRCHVSFARGWAEQLATAALLRMLRLHLPVGEGSTGPPGPGQAPVPAPALAVAAAPLLRPAAPLQPRLPAPPVQPPQDPAAAACERGPARHFVCRHGLVGHAAWQSGRRQAAPGWYPAIRGTARKLVFRQPRQQATAFYADVAGAPHGIPRAHPL